MRILTIALLLLGLTGARAFAKAEAAGSTSLLGDASPSNTQGADGAGSLEVVKCDGNCADSAYDRSRGKRTDPGTYVNALLDTSKKFDADAEASR